MKNKKIIAAIIITGLLILLGYTLNNANKHNIKPVNKVQTKNSVSTTPAKQTTQSTNTIVTPTPVEEDRLCGWIDKSDIIIKLSFAKGVVKDSSYTAGFHYNPVGSDMRMARGACDYRTGFTFEELKGKGVAQVNVAGFSDSTRRQLENDPITVTFDQNGKPNIPKVIEVKVLN